MMRACLFVLALFLSNLYGFVNGDYAGGVTNKEWEAIAEKVSKSPHCLTKNDMSTRKHISPQAGPPPPPSPSTATTCPTTISSMGISITMTTDTVTIKGSGCPGYDWTSQSTPNQAKAGCKSITVPRNARINNTPYIIGIWKIINPAITQNDSVANYVTTNPYYYGANSVKGPIGVAVNGIQLYSNADAENRDAYFFEAKTFDKCRGHPTPASDYHYHAYTNCTGQIDTAGQHSMLMGVMADGIPLYGPLGDDGVAPTDLDECNGHTDRTYSFYHYHVPASWNTYPYLVNCLKGCLTSTNLPSGQNLPSCVSNRTYDYSAVWTVFQQKASQYPLAATGLCGSSGVQQAVVSGFVILLVAVLAILF